MKKEIALDLRLSRAKSGLSGKDLAHLLGCNKERISKLENGKARIGATEIAALSLIYGSSPTDLLHHVIRHMTQPLKLRLSAMPDEPHNWAQQVDVRLDTLNGLAHRLQTLTRETHDA